MLRQNLYKGKKKRRRKRRRRRRRRKKKKKKKERGGGGGGEAGGEGKKERVLDISAKTKFGGVLTAPRGHPFQLHQNLLQTLKEGIGILRNMDYQGNLYPFLVLFH